MKRKSLLNVVSCHVILLSVWSKSCHISLFATPFYTIILLKLQESKLKVPCDEALSLLITYPSSKCGNHLIHSKSWHIQRRCQ